MYSISPPTYLPPTNYDNGFLNDDYVPNTPSRCCDQVGKENEEKEDLTKDHSELRG